MATRLLELLWNMLHSGEAPNEVLDSGAFTEILGHYDSVQRASKAVYIKRCLDMVEAEKSVLPSLRLLRDVLTLDKEKSYDEDIETDPVSTLGRSCMPDANGVINLEEGDDQPLGLSGMQTGGISRQTRLQQLEEEHGFIRLLVNNLASYLDVAKKPPLDPLSGRSKGSVLVGKRRYSHEEGLKERLAFLLWALQTGGLKMEWELADMIWSRLVENPSSTEEREIGLQWFCDALANKWAALSLNAQAELLTQRICKMDPATLSNTAFRCFQRLFLWVNLEKKKLKQPRSDVKTVTVDLDLDGLAYMWEVVLHSPVDDIANDCIHLLRDVHTCLAENLEAEVVQIRQRFLDECLRHLSLAAKACGISHSGESADSCCSAASDVDYRSGAREMETSDIEKRESSPASTLRRKSRRQGSGTQETPSAVPNGAPKRSARGTALKVQEIDQVERCLRLLMVFITKCEGKGPRKLPAHGASFQGLPLRIDVTTANKAASCFHFEAHTNEYLASLRQKVAQKMDLSPSRVRLIYGGKELVQDWQVLRQCGITQATTNIAASISLNDRLQEPMDELRLPGILVSRQKEVYNILFKLLETSSYTVREAADSLLMLLPTHPDIVQTFLNLSHVEEPEQAQGLLRQLFDARSRTLYTLQVLDGLLMPVNRRTPRSRTNKFRANFLRAGGFRCVLGVFDWKGLPFEVDDRTRRGCYASAIRVIHNLLHPAEKEEEAAVPVVEDEPTCLIRADGTVLMESSKGVETDEAEDVDVVVSMSETTNGAIDIDETPDKVVSEVEVRPDPADMSQVVTVLANVTWATAMGDIGAMGNRVPMATFVKRGEELGKEPMSETQAASSASGDEEEEGPEFGQDQGDFILCKESFLLLMNCLQGDERLLEEFFNAPTTAQFIVDTSLHCPNVSLRFLVAETLLKRSEMASIARKKTLAALLAAKEEADRQPRQGSPYWELLCRLVEFSREPEEVEVVNTQLLPEIALLKSASPCTDERDKRMEGHLRLLKVLVDVLHVQVIGGRKPGGHGLIQLLLKDFLFPASVIINEALGGTVRAPKIEFGTLRQPPEEDKLLQPRCGTSQSRVMAFQLLLALCAQSADNLKEIMISLTGLHFHNDFFLEWDYVPTYVRRPAGGYVGLKNAGATCYMNSVFQQLFMQPHVRKSILSCEECDERERPESVFFQVQSMFGALLGSSLDHYIPVGFWCAYRDYDGMPINLREHQDAFEFFNRLYDSVDETLKGLHQEASLTRIFGGCFAQQVICKGCPHQSEREELFAAISVDVKNKRDLHESLEAFVRGDLLEADNAYYCEVCAKKVDALKRVCVKALPQSLVIHLKRFDFDYESMQRLKLKDRFEFPIHLSMKPFTVEGLAAKERAEKAQTSGSAAAPGLGQVDEEVAARWQGKGRGSTGSGTSDVAMRESPDGSAGIDEEVDEDLREDTFSKRQMLERSTERSQKYAPRRMEETPSADSSEADGSEKSALGSSGQTVEQGKSEWEDKGQQAGGAESGFMPDSYYEYDLVGVVVHSGTAFAGHYYSYIKERSGEEAARGGRWLAFDDKRVEPYDVNDLEKDCFGGKSTVEVYDNFLKTTSPQEFDRPNSAYMLFYERSSPAPADAGSPIASQSSAAAAASASASAPAPAPAGFPCKGREELPESLRVGSGSAEQTVVLPPSIHKMVWEANLRFMHETHLLDGFYFRFLRVLMEYTLEIVTRGNTQKQLLLQQATPQQEGEGRGTRVDSRTSEAVISVMVTVDALATQAVELALDFLCGVFLRMAPSLRASELLLWRAVLFQLLEVSPAACKAFNKKLVVRHQWLTMFLLQCPADDIRSFFAALLVQCLKCANRFLHGKPLLMHPATGRNQDVYGVEQLIAALVHLIQEPPGLSNVKHQPLNFFNVLYEYASLGQPQRHLLIQKRVIQTLVEYALQMNTKVELGYLHVTVSLLARSCEICKFYDWPQEDPDEESGQGSSHEYLPNPHQIRGPLVALSSDAYQMLSRREYLGLLAEAAYDCDDATYLLQFLVFQSNKNSTTLLIELMTNVRRSVGQELRFNLSVLFNILSVDDGLKDLRIQAVIQGNDQLFRAPSGLIDLMIYVKNMSNQKRLHLMKFILRVAKGATTAANMRALLLPKKESWRKLLDWLAEQAQHDLPSSSAGGSSSAAPAEDGGVQQQQVSAYLQRTASAEVTLKEALALLSP
eukprot:TRINITY_DN4491_c0_g1_i1.p1 TRINITY_DN4491_c0_g1~~TRINITY_DN4491_c0_g1_i1.p1  ORF type:complete len:2223 (-),score=458.73 TRINITY_DN4491_c0_g1_i1:345-6917(-)